MELAPLPPIDCILAFAALLAPLAAFAVIMPFLRAQPRLSAGISLTAIGVSLLAAVVLLVRHWQMPAPLLFETTWVVVGRMEVTFGLLVDATSLLMLLVVAAISGLIQVYSLGYMAGDPGFGRYYACMSLFAWAMLTLTLSSSLLQLYIFWELVGLASYLLIGFWYEKFSASEAGKKAFVMTRFGDVAFLLGLVLLWLHLDPLSIAALNDPAVVRGQVPPTMITLSALLIFGGIVGKSAQFPLLTWLPDAMEGPTPVSALLHSATMVAAGVYLFARMYGFFSLSPTAMTICLAIGTISMLMAATMATVASDIKQVWAFSTISQLGFMLMGLGAGSFYAGMFHLTTHAGFKALLFLCAGILIHHCDTNDMFAIGEKGGRRLKTAMVTMILGAAALSGLPPLSGFFSKEMILGHLAHHGHPVWLAAGLLGTFLTAYYTFRLIFVILFARTEDARDMAAHHHEHGHGMPMAVPVILLAGVSLVLGFLQQPLMNFLQRSLGAGPVPDSAHPTWLPVTALILVAAAIAVAWIEFGRKKAARTGFVERLPGLAGFFRQRWYLDRVYRRLLDSVIYQGFSRLFAFSDQKIIDGFLDGLSETVVAMGRKLAKMHTGMLQYRLMVLFAVVTLLAIYFGLST